jgi:uncharacterized protein (DUF1501 family)
MKRRNFIKAALAGGALYSAGGLPVFGNIASANDSAMLGQRILVNVMLNGAPDFRHLFPPPYDSNTASYGYRYWQARASAHSIPQSNNAYQDRWSNDYYPVSDGATSFGILNHCGWLKSMWDQGNVAIVCNAVGGVSRDHKHCELVMEHGNLTTGPNDYERSGWGGRLAHTAGGNVLSLTRIPRPFCFGPHPVNPELHDNSNLVSARNTREMSLFTAGPEHAQDSPTASITRSLERYYAAKSNELSPDSIYYRFIELEHSLRKFGEPIEERLQSVPVPDAISALMNGGLASKNLGEQIRNLYDSIVFSDITSLRVASLEYGSWDSHKDQKDLIETKFEDLFGTGKALDTLYQELPPATQDNMVLVLGGEFGRQLKANGDNGTDHGRGNSMLIIGNAVRGGVYGDMFPESELERLDDRSSDINGLTTFDQIYARVCDWVSPGSSLSVFPDQSQSTVEAGVLLDDLFI